MNPPISQASREKVEAWLRYYADLGVHHFYRGRCPAGAIDRTGAAPAAPAERDRDSISWRPREAAKTSGQGAGAPTVLAVVQAPSLFEAVERVEGDTLERIREDIGDCTRCRLHKHRTHIVFGVGSAKAELVFIGEGPGHDEDAQGIPFVGRAGQLLTQMVEAMGLRREDVYICNVVKCRPPENRTPEKDEIATCSPFLLRQLAAINPKVVCCLGNIAAQTLLGIHKSISHYRGQWFDYRGGRLIATYHPAYLLRNPAAKAEVWNDLQKIMAVLGLKPRSRRSPI